MKLFVAVIVKGDLKGAVGLATVVNYLGNVKFYPNNDFSCCVTLRYNEIEYKE